MKIVAQFGKSDLATVYVAEMGEGHFVEFVESVEPPIPAEKKWVSIVSTMYGCPAGCLFCDAGREFKGKLDAKEIIDQIDYLVTTRYPSRSIPSEKWKIQFARMGDPAFNPAVLDVLEQLPTLYDAPGLMPSISTIAPVGTDKFFERLLELKHRLYPLHFQFQFSVHSTDKKARTKLIPVRTWDLDRMADFGKAIYENGGRKVALNFALMEEVPIDPDVISAIFSPEYFVIKVTPLNPTVQVTENQLKAASMDGEESLALFKSLRNHGFEVIVSIGELAENEIGSNCGQYVSAFNQVNL